MSARKQYRAQLLATIRHERMSAARQLERVRHLPAQFGQFSHLASEMRSRGGFAFLLSVLATLGTVWVKKQSSGSFGSNSTRRH